MRASTRSPAIKRSTTRLCSSLYANGATAVVAPYYHYSHSSQVAPGDGCPTGTSATTGLAFNEGSSFPGSYAGALFFADYARNCIWAMLDTTGDGVPDAGSVEGFRPQAGAPVDLEFGPDGSLFYADLVDGEIRQISYIGPTAKIATSTTSGDAPLDVDFDASGSSDPDDPFNSLSFAWDLDGDGQYDDSTDVAPTYHLRPARHLHGSAARHGPARQHELRLSADQRRGLGARSRRSTPRRRRNVVGRGHDRVQRHRHRSGGRRAAGIQPLLEDRHPPLPGRLSRARPHRSATASITALSPPPITIIHRA